MSEPANQPVVLPSAPQGQDPLSSAVAALAPAQPSATPIADNAPPVQPVGDPLQAVAAAVPQAVQQQADAQGFGLNPAQPTGTTAKEVAAPGITLERPQFDAVNSGQITEVEPAHEMEMPPEVDGYLKKVANDVSQLPQEVVIVNDPAAPPPTSFLAKPVIILPITPEVEKVGKHKSTKKSIRWLVEWSEKIMKMFDGAVIYRQEAH